MFIFMLPGCTSMNAPTSTPVIQPSTEAITASPSHTPTATAIPSPTKHAEVDLPEGCIELTPTTLNPTNMEGLLILIDWANISGTDYLFDPQVWRKINIVEDEQKSFHAYTSSPNKRNLLASIEMNDGTSYYAFKTPGKVSKIDLPIPDNWIFSWWSDNEHMVFYTLEPNEYLNSWNPFTGEFQRIQLDLPNAIDEYFSPGRNIIHAYIDPTMERVFYGSKDGRLILWNITTNKEITSLPKPAQEEGSSANAFWPYRGWLPEEQKLITSWPIWHGNRNPPANELYVFDIQGNISQLTSLNQEYSFANAEDPVWNSDGSQVGFWLKIGDDNSTPLNLHQWLAVFNTNTKETKVYCLANSIPKRHAWHIIWSPSGQQLIVNVDIPNGKFSPVMVDLENQTQNVLDLPDMGVVNPNILVEDWILR